MEIVVRIVILYFFIVVGLRIIGKREFAQLSPLELVLLLLIPEIASQALVGEDFSVTRAMVGISTLLSLVFLSSLLMQKSRRAEVVIAGEPVLLVRRGEMIEPNMARERITPEELFTEMHKAGIERLEQVRWAILEADGRVAIVPEGGPAVQQARVADESVGL
jgi:uncharacterized membrane protein YcaP (DUF421 family)